MQSALNNFFKGFFAPKSSITCLSRKLPVNSLQRRAFFRLEHICPVFFRSFDKEKQPNELKSFLTGKSDLKLDGKSSLKGAMANISGNGLLLLSENLCEIEDVLCIRCWFYTREIRALARVCRNQQIGGELSELYETGLEFVEISPEDRSHIISIIIKRLIKESL